jgi:hypothetical protein
VASNPGHFSNPKGESKMKFRKSEWLSLETVTPKFGIQAREKTGDKWAHVCEASKPLIFDTATERDDKIKELKRG